MSPRAIVSCYLVDERSEVCVDKGEGIGLQQSTGDGALSLEVVAHLP